MPGRDRLERGPGAQEHLPPIARRPPAPQVGGDRLADVGGQRQPVLAAALAAHDQLARAPVDVIKRQPATSPRRSPSRSSMMITA